MDGGKAKSAPFTLQPYQTVIISFKDEKGCISRLVPNKPLKILDEEVPTDLLFNQGDGQWWEITNGRMQDKIKLIQDISKLDYCAIDEDG